MKKTTTYRSFSSIFYFLSLISLISPREQVIARLKKEITTSCLQISPHLMIKFFLMVIVSGIIIIFLGEVTLSNDNTTTTAYAHFFGGKTVIIEDYQVVFLPSPSSPRIGDNSTTLNFSVLKNNTNIYNIHSAVVITEKGSRTIVDQIPYKFYEFSDITVPYTFENPVDYTVTLQTRIAGNEKYQATPLVASFDIAVGDPSILIPFDELMLFYVTPVTLVVTGIMIYLHVKGKF
jgi:hypothetical protein